VRQYFTLPTVIAGLFRVVETLFGVKLRRVEGDIHAWHPDAELYRIENAEGRSVGLFYLDLYARDGKRSGAWMDHVRSRWLHADGTLQTPVATLTCNFPSPVGGKPALLSHDDVQTLFHEFGHGLHHMLTQVDDIAVSGISGVEWDAVELPSQLMENFCWEWEVLRFLTHHVETGQAMPRALFDKMLAAKNFQSGMQTLRQVEFSLLDMRLHHDLRTYTPEAIEALVAENRDEIAVLKPPRSTASSTASPTSSPGATQRATTATNGLKCCRPTPLSASNKKARSVRKWARAISKPFSPWAEAAMPSTRSKPSVAASRASMPCSATAV
jgi:oligopeptidase A (EC:3.4.24.70). Metallo peptidase. MEROPS family M03A